MSADELRELDCWIAEHVMGWQWWRFNMSGDRWCQLVPPEEKWPKFKKEWHGILCKTKIDNMEDCTDLSMFRPSTHPAAAMQVLEKCAQKCTEQWDVHRPDATLILHAPHPEWDNKWVIMSDIEGTITATAETLLLTICQFAKQIFSK